MNRSKPNSDDVDDWINRRNTQCNFDTLLQVISLRSQPEVIKMPNKINVHETDFGKFGVLYRNNLKHYWKFEFEVQHSSVFENGIVPLGALYKDCDGVPMILCYGQQDTMPAFLDTSDELKNIYFEVV
jgi:hypothetical protein